MQKQQELISYLPVLEKCVLFDGVIKTEMMQILSDTGELQSYGAGQIIFAPDRFKDAVGIFLEGRAKAEKIAEDKAVELNRFEPPMMFGAAAVFRETEEYVTRVTALAACKILFFTGSQLSEMFRLNVRISENYIGFLSGRIAFLNRKIDSFTQNNAEEKMALYLHDLCGAKKESFEIPCSPTRLASELGISRATVYRALGTFEQTGIICREGKKLKVLYPERLLDYRERRNAE